MNEPMHQKNKESFGIQTRAPYDDGASRRGDLYFKSGKDACISSNLKNKNKKIAHIFFELITGKSLMRSSKMVEKERSIVVMIIKNRF